MSFQTAPASNLGQDAPKPVIQETIPNQPGLSGLKDKAEEQKVEEKAKEPEKEQISSRVAEMIKREKRVLREKQQAHQLIEAAKRKEQELAAREAKLKEFEAINDPIKALQARGFTYQQATEWMLNNGNPPPEAQIDSVRKEMEAFKRQQEEERQRLLNEQKKAAESELNEVLNQFRTEITQFTKDKTEDYELINLLDQQDLVYDTIQEYFNANQRILSIKEASDLVEKYLEDQVKKTTATKKFQKLYQPKEAAPQKAASSDQPRPQTQSRTLNNNMTSSAAGYLPAKTEQERLQRALAALTK